MKILILSASIGAGHMQAAEAIAEVFNGKAQVLDFMDKQISILNWLLKKFYLCILGLVPDLYDRIYRLAGVRRFGSITRLIWSTLMYLPFAKLVNEFKPEVIICTHPFPEAAAALWKFLHPNSDRRFTLAAVLTDYSIHEIWIYDGVDVYFVATEQMRRELQEHGQENVHATGIPIRQAFQAFRSTPLNTEGNALPNVLIMGGGLGLGAFEETIRALEDIDFKLKLTVITGRNEHLQNKLKGLTSKHELTILGFVDNICELMQKADILISKPGALTLSEAFAAGLPILLLPPIPGPEALNAEYAVKGGAALSLNSSKEIAATIGIVNDSVRLKSMKESSRKLAKPAAAVEIVKNIER